MNTQEIKVLRDRRQKLIADARTLHDTATPETPLSAEDHAKVTAMLAEARQVGTQIERDEQLDAEERVTLPETQRTEAEARLAREQPEKAAQRRRYGVALGSYLRQGFPMMSGDDQRALQQGYVPFDGEFRTQSTLSGAAGGFAVAPDTSFYGRIIEAEKFVGPLMAPSGLVTVLNTATGADLPIGTDDDTSNTGARIAEEGTHTGGTNVTLGQKILKAYLYSSKIVKVSWQLLQDSELDFEAYLGRKLGMRLGRIKNQEFTTFSGASGPQGVQFGAPVGRTGATGFATTTDFDELKRAKHSVDIAYRAAGRWMFNDTTALDISLLKDSQGRYLLTDSVREGDPMRLLGHPVAINNDMPDMAASVKAILFGDFSFYYVRNVRGLQVVRLSELYAENGQVGFMAFERADAGLIDAGQGPIKAWQNSAT